MIIHRSENDHVESDGFDKLDGYESRLKEIKAKIPENPFAKSSAFLSAGEQQKPEMKSSDSKQDPIESAYASSQAIGRGFEIYAQVLTGALMIAIPAVGGYFLDQSLAIMFFAPVGGVVGMVAGLSYLLKISKNQPKRSR